MSEIKKIVFVLNGHDAVLRRWAIEYIYEDLKKMGFDVKIVDLAAGGNEAECERADVVLVYRCFDLRTIRIMKRVRMQGPFVLYFIDDYLFQPDCKFTGGWKYTIEPMKEADAIMSSSSMLLSKIPLDKPKILRRSVLDDEAMSVLRQEYRRPDSVFSIGWITGRGRGNVWDKFVAEFLESLNAMMTNDEKCIFHCFGPRMLKQHERISVKENVYFETGNWKGLYLKIKSFNLGVAINPLDEHDEFCKCKSELKFVETAAMGVPLVTSRVPPYTEFIRDGKNGFLASTPREFADKVLTVMRDEPMSRIVSKNVYEYVTENYNVRKNTLKFVDDVRAAIDTIRRKT